jgi:hypothetical protein
MLPRANCPTSSEAVRPQPAPNLAVTSHPLRRLYLVEVVSYHFRLSCASLPMIPGERHNTQLIFL